MSTPPAPCSSYGPPADTARSEETHPSDENYIPLQENRERLEGMYLAELE